MFGRNLNIPLILKKFAAHAQHNFYMVSQTVTTRSEIRLVQYPLPGSGSKLNDFAAPRLLYGAGAPFGYNRVHSVAVEGRTKRFSGW